jgi:diketogulonate reductase-like aldo/keto reductase
LNSPDNALRFPGRIGLGTRGLGESEAQRDQEIAAVRSALDMGYRVFDTAELYGEGNERILGGAFSAFGAARRSELFIVGKVLPDNASRAGTVQSCEATVKRLGCEYLDLYLLHWRGPHALTETMRAFDDLLQRGLVRNIGVSNFSVDDLEEWRELEKVVGLRSTVKCNQISYRVDRRGIEYGLLAWHRAHGIASMAYGPLGEGALTQHPLLVEIGRERGVSAGQIALAWCLREPDIVVIPKSSNVQRMQDNFGASNVHLNPAELARIDQAFPLRLRWLKQNPLLRQARSAVRRLKRRLK